MEEKESRNQPTTGEGNSPESGDGRGGGEAGGRRGWGGWGFSSFSVFSDLQKAASAAAQEISRNAAAVAKSITDLEIAEGDSKSDLSVGKEGMELESDIEDEGNLLRKSALDKLERASEESFLGQGLKVLDNSVESLASGAWLAFGNALKGGSDLVHKLETNLADTIQNTELPGKAASLTPSILETGKSFTARGIQVLERVGKETMDLLISEAGLEVEKSPKKDNQLVDEEPFEEVTFDRCFYIYGGPDHLEELEALSSHYALLFNRKRTKLASEQKSFYDGKLKQILQIFSLDSDPDEGGVGLDKGKNVVTANDCGSLEMKTLRDSSVSKAADMAAGFTAALGGMAANDMIQRTMDRLETVHSEGVHRLSEFCCFALSYLLMLGKSVSSINKSKSQEAEDNIKIDWPEDSVLKAKIIKSKVQFMSVGVESVSNSFLTGITDITEAYQAAMKTAASAAHDQLPQNYSVQEKANTVSGLLKSDRSTALEKIQEALRALTYVVISSSMPSM